MFHSVSVSVRRQFTQHYVCEWRLATNGSPSNQLRLIVSSIFLTDQSIWFYPTKTSWTKTDNNHAVSLIPSAFPSLLNPDKVHIMFFSESFKPYSASYGYQPFAESYKSFALDYELSTFPAVRILPPGPSLNEMIVKYGLMEWSTDVLTGTIVLSQPNTVKENSRPGVYSRVQRGEWTIDGEQKVCFKQDLKWLRSIYFRLRLLQWKSRYCTIPRKLSKISKRYEDSWWQVRDLRSQQFLQRFRREFPIWGRVQHENIVPLYGIWMDPYEKTDLERLPRLVSPWYGNNNVRAFLNDRKYLQPPERCSTGRLRLVSIPNMKDGFVNDCLLGRGCCKRTTISPQ